MRRAKYDEHKCDVLAQEQLCLSYLIGRMPVHPKKQDVSWDEHVGEDIISAAKLQSAKHFVLKTNTQEKQK